MSNLSIDERSDKMQVSSSSTEELVRNFMHRIAVDGTLDYNGLQYIQGISATLAEAMLKGPEKHVAVVDDNTTNLNPLVHGYPNMKIVVFDILLSINAASVISLTDATGNNLLAPMYAPNAGQGYTMNSFRGKHLPWDKGLFVQSSSAVSYGIDISYCYIERSGGIA